MRSTHQNEDDLQWLDGDTLPEDASFEELGVGEFPITTAQSKARVKSQQVGKVALRPIPDRLSEEDAIQSGAGTDLESSIALIESAAPEKIERLPLKDFLPELRFKRLDPDAALPTWELTPKRDRTSDSVRVRIASMLAVGAALAMVVYSWFEHQEQSRAIETPSPSPASSALPPHESGPVVSLIHDSLGRYLRSESVQERLAWVRQPLRVQPMMEAHYQSHPIQPDQLTDIDMVAKQTLGKFEYYVAQAHTLLGKDERFILFKQGGKFLIDWETHVGHNDLSWAQLNQTRPHQLVTLRAYAVVGDYYNYHYLNRRDHVCVELREPHSNDILYGYLDRTSERVDELLWHLRSGDEMAVMVQVNYESESRSTNQVRIERFLQGSWLVLEAS